jgi:hypothetical protein
MDAFRIQPQLPRTTYASGRSSGAREAGAASPSARRNAAAASFDEVSLGSQMPRMAFEDLLQGMLVERVLARVAPEAAGAIAPDRLRDAGKDAVGKAAPSATGISPVAAADQIVQGVAGHIFSAFRANHPEMTEADFGDFRDQTMTGFAKGIEDARDIFTGLQAMTPQLEERLARVEVLTRQRLTAFFDGATGNARALGSRAESAPAIA